MTSRTKLSFLAAAALVLAACGGGSSGAPVASRARLTRGTVTAIAGGVVTVNAVQLSTSGATIVRVDDAPGGLDDVKPGDVVTVRGTFDDRTGTATEIEVEHAMEGQVDDKGVDFVMVGGERIQVDDSTHFGDDHPNGLDSVSVGSVVRISGASVAGVTGAVDDQGGLRASRIELSPRNGGSPADDAAVDVKGFVSALDGGAKTFQLRASPDAAGWWIVSYGAIALPAGVADGSYVEVVTTTAPVAGVAPVLGTLSASAIRLEDRFAGEAEVEVEGYVTSLAGALFVVDGVRVQTSGVTRYALGIATDLAVGVKVEVEGTLDGAAVLHAEKITFRSGVRMTATVQNYTGSSLTLLGVVVQLPSRLRNDVGALSDGLRIELRGSVAADGLGVVADRIVAPSGGGSVDRVFLRAVVSAKSAAAESLTVLGFAVNAAGASLQTDGSGGHGSDVTVPPDRAAFYAAVDPGRTVVKVRASSAANVSVSPSRTWIADEVEIDGND